MRLCIVANGDFFSDYGGGQIYVKNLVNELIQQQGIGLELTIVSITSFFQKEPTLKQYRETNLYELNPSGDITALLQTIRPDVVHAHGEKALVVKVCHQIGIKCIVTAHHGGICCPAGTLMNENDQICHKKAHLKRCLPCYLRNIRTGRYWYPLVRILPTNLYIRLGRVLKQWPFIPFISPIGEAMLSIQEKLERWSTVRDMTSYIIAPSNAIADSMILNGCDRNKITVISHGIPLPEESESASIKLMNEKPQTIAFYYVGRICYVKGIHVMLEAFSSIDHDNIELHLIGGSVSKSEQRYQHRLQKKYASDKRIVWHGKVEPSAVNLLVSNYHCLIHPAIYLEVFGLNIAEALALHKYVIASRCGGAEMQIADSDSGVLIKPNSVMELRNALLQYVDKPISSHANVISLEEHTKQLISFYQKEQVNH